MKKLTAYKIAKFRKNLEFIYNFAQDQDLENGKAWYKDAHAICHDISEKYNVSTLVAAKVISALSPRNKWERNIFDAYQVFDAVKAGKGPDDIKVCTFTGNKLKAFAIVEGTKDITTKSLKTYNFWHNIAYLCSESVTVDIWHLRACLGDKLSIDSASIGKTAYGQIKDLTLRMAEKANMTGFEFQAIIWLAAQRYFAQNDKI